MDSVPSLWFILLRHSPSLSLHRPFPLPLPPLRSLIFALSLPFPLLLPLPFIYYLPSPPSSVLLFSLLHLRPTSHHLPSSHLPFPPFVIRQKGRVSHLISPSSSPPWSNSAVPHQPASTISIPLFLVVLRSPGRSCHVRPLGSHHHHRHPRHAIRARSLRLFATLRSPFVPWSFRAPA